jgi:signal transduction histidine kinase
VIAHEVRNPLMIIKGALRTMARDGATVRRRRDAAKDIDEEIERLNSLVNDVLDVARPIRFDSAPADINVVCRDAVEAASAGRVNGPVTLTLAPALPELGHRQRAAPHGARQPPDQRRSPRSGASRPHASP